MNVLRDIFRRRTRSILTITGIAVGVFALVVLGAVAENQNVYMDKALGYYDEAIVVIEKEDANFVGMASGNRPLSVKKAAELQEFPGVKAAFPQVGVLFDDEYVSVIPPMVLSVAPGSESYEPWEMATGRAIRGDESGVAMVGTDLARKLDATIGERITVRGKRFDVVGIMDRTYVNLIDSTVYVPLADAQQLYFASLPEAFRSGVDPEDLAVQMEVFVEPGADPDAVANRMNRELDDIRATGPKAMGEVMQGLIALINGVLAAVAAIALIVCVLSIVNTMMMSVNERTREIGVKRALGASRSDIMRDVLFESAVMGGLGGLVGLAFGALAASGLNAAVVAATGTSMLLVTVRLAVSALVFAVALGTMGGLYPARHASKLDPATALAYE